MTGENLKAFAREYTFPKVAGEHGGTTSGNDFIKLKTTLRIYGDDKRYYRLYTEYKYSYNPVDIDRYQVTFESMRTFMMQCYSQLILADTEPELLLRIGAILDEDQAMEKDRLTREFK